MMTKMTAIGLAVCLSAIPSPAQGAAPARSAAPPLRVLLVTGGHDFDRAPFFAMFEGRSDISCRKAAYPEAAALLKPGLEKDCDAIVMYDMVKAITPDEQRAFVALLNEGIGLVLLHHDLGAHGDWPEFTKIRGGRYFFQTGTVEGQAYPASTYAEGETVNVRIADRDHEITGGLKDFVLHDEVYGGCYVAPTVHVLLETDHPRSVPALAWVHTYGKSRVFYLMSGHDSAAWKDPSFATILFRGIRWASGRGDRP